MDMVADFGKMKIQNKAYQYSGWIPREHLLVMLSHHDRDVLRSKLEKLDTEVHLGKRWKNYLQWFSMDVGEGNQRHFIVNAHAGTVLETNRDAVLLMEFLPPDVPTNILADHFPALTPVFQA